MSNQPLKHEVIIYWSQADDAFIAEMHELPGCMADGETPQAALDQIQVIARQWIESAKELGRPIPEPKARLLSSGVPLTPARPGG